MATDKTKITMEDGRIVEFGGSVRASLIRKDAFEHGPNLCVRIDARNGQTLNFTIPESLVRQFALHGASQKLGDAAAGHEDVEAKLAAIREEIDRLSRGEWTARKPTGPKASLLALALAEAKGKPLETIVEFLATKSVKEKLALRNHPGIKPIIDRIEAERAASGRGRPREDVDVDMLFGELDSETEGETGEAGADGESATATSRRSSKAA